MPLENWHIIRFDDLKSSSIRLLTCIVYVLKFGMRLWVIDFTNAPTLKWNQGETRNYPLHLSPHPLTLLNFFSRLPLHFTPKLWFSFALSTIEQTSVTVKQRTGFRCLIFAETTFVAHKMNLIYERRNTFASDLWVNHLQRRFVVFRF